MPQPKKKTLNPQSATPILDALRENVKKLNNWGFGWNDIAARAEIHPQRLRRIVLYGYEPTLGEAERLDRAMKQLVNERIEHLKSSTGLNLALS